MRHRLAIALTAAVLAMAAAAQTTGDWIYHARFAGTGIQRLIDTRDCTYYLVFNSLFRYDKQTLENEAINHRNKLSDVTITGIYYNNDRQLLAIAYDNSNIDILLNDGAVVNVPELKNASMTADKTINDITFAEGHMMVATGFGFIDFDDENWTVRRSRNFGTNVRGAAIVGERVIYSANGHLYFGTATTHYETLSEMRSVECGNGAILPIDGSSLLIVGENVNKATVDGDNISIATVIDRQPTDVQRTMDGYVANFPNKEYYYTIDKTATTSTRVQTTANTLHSQAPDGDGTMWTLNNDGLHAGDAEPFIPTSYGIATTPFYLNYNEAEQKLYVASTTDNAVLPKAESGAKTEVYTLDMSGRWSDVTPPGVPEEGMGNHALVFCPADPSTYFFTTRLRGICRARGGELTAWFNAENSPMGRTRELAFDAQGNLWAVDPNPGSTGAPNVIVLPRAKVLANDVKLSDWVTPTIARVEGASIKRGAIAVGQGGNMVFSPGGYLEQVTFWQPDASTMAARNHATYTSFTDQDGQTVKWEYVYCLTADRNGIVWMGTSAGVVSFNPSQAYASDFRINHIKVPRNDNTGTADYLLDGTTVTCIAVDAANRKWLGTNGNGLFLVSEDGTQILKEFNSSNSYLPGNIIYSVACNASNNSVYVMTNKGLAEYISDSGGTPDHELDNLLVYPNPVRPDFMGLITIQGLRQGSIVKIADSSGLVIKQFKSDSGTATWDGCGLDGNRVSTGVYYVIASYSENGGSSQQAITKLAIIR